MLARSGAIPCGRGWLYEPKLDGFRCLVCTHRGFAPLSPRVAQFTEGQVTDADLSFASTLPTR